MNTAIADPASGTANSAPFHILAAVFFAVCGFLLFLISRKLVWGREEAVIGASIWSLAVAPYVAYFAFRLFTASLKTRPINRDGADFAAIWTCSLFIFVVARWSALGDLFEDPIYDAFSPGLIRYALLSTIYMSFGFLTVLSWRLANNHSVRAITAPRAASYLAGVVLFCCNIFLIAV